MVIDSKVWKTFQNRKLRSKGKVEEGDDRAEVSCMDSPRWFISTRILRISSYVVN